MAKFGKKEEAEEPKKEEEFEPAHPFVLFTVIDGNHLDVTMGWPKGCDVSSFAKVLAWLNSGKLVEPQTTAAIMRANKENEPEKAIIICAALESISRNKQSSKPLIMPSKVIPHNMKLHGY